MRDPLEWAHIHTSCSNVLDIAWSIYCIRSHFSESSVTLTMILCCEVQMVGTIGTDRIEPYEHRRSYVIRNKLCMAIIADDTITDSTTGSTRRARSWWVTICNDHSDPRDPHSDRQWSPIMPCHLAVRDSLVLHFQMTERKPPTKPGVPTSQLTDPAEKLFYESIGMQRYATRCRWSSTPTPTDMISVNCHGYQLLGAEFTPQDNLVPTGVHHIENSKWWTAYNGMEIDMDKGTVDTASYIYRQTRCYIRVCIKCDHYDLMI